MAQTIYMKTTADHCLGFPLLLWEVVCDALGAPNHPEYVVFRSGDSPAGYEFRAVVCIQAHPLRRRKSYEFSGRFMPTLEIAFQVAAFESLSCLRWMEPALAEHRSYFYFPAISRSAPRPLMADTRREADSAIVHLVSYLAAMEQLNHSLMAELRVARQGLGHASLQSALVGNSNPATQNLAQIQPAEPQPADLGPSQQNLVPGQLQRAPQVPEPVVPYVGSSAFEESMARARQRLVVSGPILQGIPVVPAPEEEEGVDTTLRLRLATPDAHDRHVE